MLKEKEVQPRPGGKVCRSLGIYLHHFGRPARKSFRETLLCPSQMRHCVDSTCPRPCSMVPRGGPSFWSSNRRSAWQWATPRERQYGHGQTQVAKTRAWVLWCTRGAVGTTHTLMPYQQSLTNSCIGKTRRSTSWRCWVLLFVTTFQNIICGTAAFVFIDNTASWAAC